MTLGRLMNMLATMPPEERVYFVPLADAIVQHGAYPGMLHSYRGYYIRLAIEPSDEPTTVGELLANLRAALGAKFQGYKGGEYEMHPGSLVHVAPWGVATQDRPVAVERRENGVAILVAHVPED